MILKKITSKKSSMNKLGSRRLGLQRHASTKKIKLVYKKSLKKRQFGGAEEIYRNSVPVKRIVLYALSANPPTLAHEDIIKQLSGRYDAVFVWASSNWLKLDPSKPEYDPLYKSEVTRSELLNKVLTGITNVKVDYEPEREPKYNHTNTGISVKKFIDANLSENTPIQQGAITFKQFNLKTQTPYNDTGFLNQCGILPENNVELWVCFGLDVVRDTPTWGPNNVFLTRATGIVMINREGESGDEREGPGLFSIAQNTQHDISNTTYCKMPFFDWFPYSNKLNKRNIDLNSQKFKCDFNEIEKEPKMKLLLSNLEDLGNLKMRDQFNVDALQPFLVPIEISKIKINEMFSRASSTKVRNLAVQGELGGRKGTGVDQIFTTLVNYKIKDDIYRLYGRPTIREQIAIIEKSFKSKKMNADEIHQKFNEMTPIIQKNVLELMKDNDLNKMELMLKEEFAPKK